MRSSLKAKMVLAMAGAAMVSPTMDQSTLVIGGRPVKKTIPRRKSTYYSADSEEVKRMSKGK